MIGVDYSHSKITGGFWRRLQDTVRNVTAASVYKRFDETGRIGAFSFDWKPGMPDQPHIFWDSDVAKWMEGASYIIHDAPSPELEAQVDSLVDKIAEHQGDDGYFNIYYTVVEPDNRFTQRGNHELYCAGHLIEAAVAYYEATGKGKFLDCMKKYADYIDTRFRVEQDTAFMTPGHEEIELALVRLYKCTDIVKYLELAEFFIDMRGNNDKDVIYDWCNTQYDQSDKPARELEHATGHSVRAMYFYCGMADVARESGDKRLADACRRLFNDVYNRKMYITGGIGSSCNGEAFTLPYDMPDLIAYNETCASLALALFSGRMLLLENDRRYADTVERVMYNGFLSGISLSGDAFFYENPLERIPELYGRDTSMKNQGIHFPIPERQRVFQCSCCPPNIVRFIPSIANFLYTFSEDDGIIYVQQYIESESHFEFCGSEITIKQETDYPYSGKIKLTYHGLPCRLAFRIPLWCTDFTGDVTDGYVYYNITDGKTVTLELPMKAYFVEADPRVYADCGKAALIRGPVVYCMEEADNGNNLRGILIDTNEPVTELSAAVGELPFLSIKAYRKNPVSDGLYRPVSHDYTSFDAVFVPYYTFANRGVGEMTVYCNMK